MIDSPCYSCPKCPCKEHDNCEEYLKFRTKIDHINKENMKLSDIKDYTIRSINKRKRRYRK
jgi:hypothetical protein